MSQQTEIRLPIPSARFFPSLPSVAFIAVLAATLASPVLQELVLRSGDTFMHVRLGNEILANRAPITVDPLSFTKPGAPYLAHEWGFEVIVSLLYRAFGTDGLVLYAALAGALLTYLVTRRLRSRGADLLGTLVSLAAFFALTWSVYRARPHLVTSIGLAATALALDRGWLRKKSWTVVAAVFAASSLWMNCHPGALLLLMVLAVETACWVCFEGERPAWAAAVFSAAVLGTMATPYGVAVHLNILKFMGDPALVGRIDEHRPLAIESWQGMVFLAAAAATAAGAAIRRKKLRVAELLVIAFSAAMSFKSRRYAGFFPIFALPVLAGAIDELARYALAFETKGLAERAPGKPSLGRFWAPASVCVALATVACTRGALSRATYLAHVEHPVAAAAFVGEHPELFGPRMYNTYELGGYLSFALPERKVFVDGRAEFYGSTIALEQDRIRWAAPGTLEQLKSREIDWAIFEPQYPLAALLESEGWHRVYLDRHVLIFVRPK